MSDQITLPYTLKRGANFQIIAPVLLVYPLVIIAVFYVLMQQGVLQLPLWMLGIIVVVLGVSDFVALYVLKQQLRPATVTISPTFITEEPIAIMGFSTDQEQTFALQDFTAVKFGPTVTRIGAVPRAHMYLKRRNGADYLLQPMLDRITGEQLARVMGLAVEEDVR